MHRRVNAERQRLTHHVTERKQTNKKAHITPHHHFPHPHIPHPRCSNLSHTPLPPQRVPQEPARAALRRGDVGARRRDGARRPRVPVGARGGAHVDLRRAPPQHRGGVRPGAPTIPPFLPSSSPPGPAACNAVCCAARLRCLCAVHVETFHPAQRPPMRSRPPHCLFG